ncbi:MAG TPA: response regulator [Candidatus Limnocylindrales bacterium]
MSGEHGRILVVDDTRLNRTILARALENQGHEVVEAENGRVAMELLEADGASGIDVVLLDLEMPEMDGYETLGRIKASDATAHLPVIVISSVEELDSVVRCIEMGAADYLPKPFNAAVLQARLSTSLAAKRLGDLEREYLRTIDRQRSELARFLSPQVAELVSSADGEALLDGHRRVITAVFSDLRGFTSFAETAEPEELLDMLRDYHAEMGRMVMEAGGTLEHFAGDGILVFFNDPVQQDDHEARAVRMACAMRDRFDTMHEAWRKRGYELGFGVGMAVGHATMGRIGFEGRYDYAAIGTVVIMASRLCSEARPGQILVNQRGYSAVEDIVVGEPVGDLALKGFSRPVTAYNIVGLLEGR